MDHPAPAAHEPARRVRPLYLALGLLCLGVGMVGYVVPGMPGTVFLLIALWAFKRSSPTLEDWLLNRSFAAPVLQDWERDRSMTLRTKTLAIGLVWVSILTSCWFLRKHWWAVGLLLTIAAALTWFLATRRTKR